MKALAAAVGVFALLGFANAAMATATCSYQTYNWNTLEKRAVQQQRVVHPYAELTDEERDPVTGCTVCMEDQVEIRVSPVELFYVCKAVAPQVRHTLKELLRSGEKIEHVTGYRVGRTRGDVDQDGNRTRFSNHSFGVAIDINPEHNGLYDRCITFGEGCRLIRGGEWKPQEKRQSLSPDGPVVRAFKEMGFLWGGEIEGYQKDFMHFSPTGY